MLQLQKIKKIKNKRNEIIENKKNNKAMIHSEIKD